jgi:hypothetical protein
MRSAVADVPISPEMGLEENLMRRLIEGTVDASLMTPQPPSVSQDQPSTMIGRRNVDIGSES